MKWANFLHIYQPPTQKELWIRRIAEESYRKVMRGLLEIPRAKLTLNINGILCELLEQYDGKDILKDIKTLVERGNIELTGSAKYHAFLALLPEKEIERQIRLNEETLDEYFGVAWRTPTRKGFFSPEMGYNKKVAEVALRMGYKWIVIDELAFPGKLDENHIYDIKGLQDFGVFFRERNLSFVVLSPQGAGSVSTIFNYLGDRINKDEYVVTAMDGETFGHHRPGLEKLLFDILKDERIEPVTIDSLWNSQLPHKDIEPEDSTWASTKVDMRRHTPYSRWKSEDNEIQTLQWELTNLAISVVENHPPHLETRELLDKSLHSDQYWWSSARPWWSLEMIERGAFELKTVILNSPEALQKDKDRAAELYRDILFKGFEWQRSGKVESISRQEDEEIQERLEVKEKLFISKEEYQEMIDVLEKEMHFSATSEEYHRAAMIKDRIRELREEIEKLKN